MPEIQDFSKDIAWFSKCLSNKNQLVEKLKKIKLVISDIDGTLTDANIYLPQNSEELKGISIQDGFITTKAIQAKVYIAYLSGRKSSEITKRAAKLGIAAELCAQGIENKSEKVIAMQSFANASKEETLIFGDDYLDYEIKDLGSLYVVPSNTPFYLQAAADLVIPKAGGQSPFRLLIDLILYVQEKHIAQELIKKALETKDFLY